MPDLLNKIYASLIEEKKLESFKQPLTEFLLNSKELIVKQHPLGFYSFTLGKINDKINIRLHIWDIDLVPQDKNLMIHNHIFNFKSLVLVGKICNLTYTLNESDESNGTLYSVSYNQKGSVLTKLKTGYSASLISQNTITKGQYYSIKSNEFHESVSFQNCFSATLLCTEQINDINPIVFGYKDFGDSIEFARKERKKEKIHFDINKLISLI